MKPHVLGFLPCALVALVLVAFGFVLRYELAAYRRAVETWAERDLTARTQLAAEYIGDSLESGDFARLREFVQSHPSDDIRITVLAAPGGIVFDTLPEAARSHCDRPEVRRAFETGTGHAFRASQITGRPMLFCARRAGANFVIRLAIPYETVLAPLHQNRPSLILSALIGASGILLIFLFSLRLLARNRALAHERDVQARHLAEMQRVAEFRRDFIANVSHEIKTPLTGILGAVELLAAPDALPDGDRRELLALLRRESTRLDALARDILSLARLERGEEEKRRDFLPADLADVLASAAAAVRPAADAAGIRLIVPPVPSLILPCDARLLEQALVNLVVNAIRHSGSPDVVLTLEPIPEGARFTVVDHGVGLLPADRARVFERFFRVDKSHSRATGGTGLGLAIVKHVAHLHRGDATVLSEPGRGCTFTLTIQTEHTIQENTSQERKTK